MVSSKVSFQSSVVASLWLACLRACRIEPDGQRPTVVVHGRRCRKTVSGK